MSIYTYPDSQVCKKQTFLMSATHYDNKITTELDVHNTVDRLIKKM